jgi:predicted Zn-dependent protease
MKRCLFRFMPEMERAISLLLLGWLALGPGSAFAVEKALRFKPGFNLLSPADDVQLGRKNAEQVEKQLPVLHDAEVERYVNELGRRLAAYSPENRSEYVWRFRVINSGDINAFALPGGFIYVNRATIQAAENEAQFAGVLAHEEGHVVMRHGTHQASEVMLAQFPLAILGGALGEGDWLSRLARAGIGFGVNSMFLRNSRSIEAQADQVGTYTLYQAGYDPHAMAQFFQIIQEKYPQRILEFFSDHPNPEHRIERVDEEIPQLGAPKAWKTDSPEFESVKHRLLSLPPPPKAKPQPQAPSSGFAPGR